MGDGRKPSILQGELTVSMWEDIPLTGEADENLGGIGPIGFDAGSRLWSRSGRPSEFLVVRSFNPMASDRRI
jgi:hypothetical protein